MTKRCNILGVGLFCCVLMLLPGIAGAQPFTVTSDDPGINVVPTFTYVSEDTWDLHVLVEHAASTATVDIIVSKTQGDQRPSLRDLTFDLNQNQAIESGDIETWLIEPADFNGDEVANVLDLGLLIDAVANGGDE